MSTNFLEVTQYMLKFKWMIIKIYKVIMFYIPTNQWIHNPDFATSNFELLNS